MPTLEVDNGFRKDIPGLGKIKPFPNLSPKRISRCVRDVLREEYRFIEILVECDPVFTNGIWIGDCGIKGAPHIYRIYPIYFSNGEN